MYQNVSNPWQQETVIRFDLPDASEYTLAIFDILGMRKYQQDDAGVAETNYILLSSDALAREEVLYYSLTANQYSAVKKMLITREGLKLAGSL